MALVVDLNLARVFGELKKRRRQLGLLGRGIGSGCTSMEGVDFCRERGKGWWVSYRRSNGPLRLPSNDDR